MTEIKEKDSTAFLKSTPEHHEDTLPKKYKQSIVVFIVTSIIVNVVVNVSVLVILVIQRHETPEQAIQTCMKCQTLSTIVDKWAWQNVAEDKHTDTCCFNSDTGLSATLKYFFEKHFSSCLSVSSPVTDRQQENVDQLYTLVWNHLLSNNTNATSIPSRTHPDLPTLMELINIAFNKKRSVLHLTSLNTVIAEGAYPKISWASSIMQGHLSLSNDTYAVSIMNTGLYFISTQVRFRANVINHQTMKVEVKFYIAALRQGILKYIDDYKKQYVFRVLKTEHDANLQSMTRLEKGDTLIVRFPSSLRLYLGTERGAHRISMFELS